MDIEQVIYDWYTGGKQEFEDALASSYGGYGNNKNVWKTKDGSYIFIPLMATGHLINVAKLIIRFAKAQANDTSFPDGIDPHSVNYGEMVVSHDNYEAINTELVERGITSLLGWIYDASSV